MDGAKLLGQKLRDMGNLIPKLMSGTVVSDFADPGETFVALDTAPDVPAPAQALMGTWAKGTRVKCLAYPPRGLLILGSNETANLALDALRIHLLNPAAVAVNSTLHPFQVGLTQGLNIRMSGNEILALFSGTPTTLEIQADGGGVSMFSTTDGLLDLNDSGFVSTLMAHKSDQEFTNQATYNSTVPTLGTGTNGFTFIAPPSGKGTFSCGGFGIVFVAGIVGNFWGEIREGSTIGSGTLVWNGNSDLGPDIRVEAESADCRFYLGSAQVLVTGLTPGDTYNASGWYNVEAVGGVGAGVLMASRTVTFIPSP